MEFWEGCFFGTAVWFVPMILSRLLIDYLCKIKVFNEWSHETDHVREHFVVLPGMNICVLLVTIAVLSYQAIKAHNIIVFNLLRVGKR